MMRLYYIETMNPRKACATAKHVGAQIDFVKLEVGPRGTRSKDYGAINPNQTAPTLVDGDHTLWESAAISIHLAARAGSDLWPANDVRAQAEVLRWTSWDAFHWARAIGPLYFEHFVKPRIGMGPLDPTVLERQRPLVEKHARVLDAHLEGKRFVACDRLTVADFFLDAMLPGWETLQMPLEPYANIRRWHDGLLAIDAWRDPWPKESTPFVATS